MTGTAAEWDFDPFNPGPREDRAAVFAELRERGSVVRNSSDVWIVSHFEEVRTLLSMPERFSSRPNPYQPASGQADQEMDPAAFERLMAIASVMPVDLTELTEANSIAAADPPQHTRMRRIVSRGFTPMRIEQMVDKINEIVDRCLAEGGDLDGFDVISRLAVPLPVEMISNILGLDQTDYAQVKKWSDVFAASAGAASQSPDAQVAMLEALKEFSSVFVPLVEARRQQPQNDIVSAMVRAVDDDTLTTVETLMVAITIMVAGNETSTNLIGNMTVELLNNPDQLRLLLDQPDLLAGAVEEANRLTTPIQFNFREALEDTDIGGTVIPKGAIVAVHLAAANRDPRQFADPDRFIIDRPRERSLAFGHGIHFCLGAHLATQEVNAAMRKLVPHLEHLKLSEAPLEPAPSTLLNGWQRVELVRT